MTAANYNYRVTSGVRPLKTKTSIVFSSVSFGVVGLLFMMALPIAAVAVSISV